MSNLKVNKTNLFNYGVLALPLSFAGMPLYIHAPDFYSANLGASLVSLGILLLVLRFLDAFIDPLIGVITDKYKDKRRYIIFLGLIFLAAGFLLLFNPAKEYLLLSFSIAVFNATLGFSIISINLTSLGGIWSDNYDEKTKISSAREGFGLIGLILAAILPTLLMQYYNPETSYSIFSIIMLTVLVLSALFFISWIYKFNDDISDDKHVTIKNYISSIKKNRGFYITYFVSVFASAIPANLIIFFVRDLLGLQKYLGLFLISYFISAALFLPFWNIISQKFNKLIAWKFAMILAVASFSWAYFLEDGDFYQFLLICIFSGIAFGAELALPPAILADNINKNSSTGEYSIFTLLMKLALALSIGLIFPLLQAEGFTPSAENTVSALNSLSFYYALFPCSVKISAIILLISFMKKIGGRNEKNSNNNGGLYVSN